jgi:hypothetical protein
MEKDRLIKKRWGIHFALFFVVLLSTPSLAENSSYSPKIDFRLANGMLRNTGPNGGSSLTVGALNLSFLYYVSPVIAVGVGYYADFDLGTKRVPVNGFDFSGRYYFMGQGTFSRHEYPAIASERQDIFSMYGGIEFAQRNYYAGTVGTSTPAGVPTNGNSLGINAIAGADLRLSRHFELTSELNYGAFTFASSDDNYKIAGILLKIGMGYIW